MSTLRSAVWMSVQADKSSYPGQGAYYINDPLMKWGLEAPVGTCNSYTGGFELKFVLCSAKPPLLANGGDWSSRRRR